MALADDILLQLDENPATPVYHTRAEVLAAVNEAQRLYCLLTLAYERQQTFTASASMAIRSIFSDFLVPLRVMTTGTAPQRVHPSTLGQLDGLDRSWRAATGTPQRYVYLGADRLLFYPGSSATLELTYAAEPPVLVDGATPVIAETDWPALNDYALYRCRLKEGGQELAKSLGHFEAFLDVVEARAKFQTERHKAFRYDLLPVELLRRDLSAMSKRAPSRLAS
jgi:hypothetical protein